MTCDELNCCQGTPFGYKSPEYAYGFYSSEQVYRASCGEGMVGEPVTITVERDAYHSVVSQADADAQALAAAQELAEAGLSCMAAT